jgi:hypothetical protein
MMAASKTISPFLQELEHDGAWLLEDVPPTWRASASLRVVEVPDGSRLQWVVIASWLSPDYHALLHLGYLARLRRLVGAVPAEWEPVVLSAPDLSGLLPDAYWYPGGGRRMVPVEVDLGNYPRGRLVAKLSHFARVYGRQVWGVRSPERLGQLAKALGVEVEVYQL